MNLSIENLEEIKEKFSLDEYIYRGQDKLWPLRPSLYRDKSTELYERELQNYDQLVSEFVERNIHPRSLVRDQGHSQEFAGQWLALFRHYGLLTRLLDFTLDIDTAIFFSSQKYDHEDGQLFVVNINKVIDHLRNRYNIIQEKKRIIVVNRDGVQVTYSNRNSKFFLMDRKSYELLISKKDNDFVIPLAPEVSNFRESAQRGVFIIYSDISRSLNEVLESYPRDCMTEITVKGEDKLKLRKYLYEKGITHHRLFNPVEWAIEDIKAKTDIPF
jgi:hypothetical protein